MTLTQVCSTCNAILPLTQFNWRNKEVGTRHTICKRCHAEYRRRHYLENLEKYKAKARKWDKDHKAELKQKAQKFVFEYLLEHPCVDCDESDPIVLEFDHVRGEKLATISYLVSVCNIEKIQTEIEKCDVRCANCHRRRTAEVGGWFLVGLYAEYQNSINNS
jgi:hypothetical protein